VAYQEGNPWEAALDVSKQSFLSSSFFHLKRRTLNGFFDLCEDD